LCPPLSVARVLDGTTEVVAAEAVAVRVAKAVEVVRGAAVRPVRGTAGLVRRLGRRLVPTLAVVPQRECPMKGTSSSLPRLTARISDHWTASLPLKSRPKYSTRLITTTIRSARVVPSLNPRRQRHRHLHRQRRRQQQAIATRLSPGDLICEWQRASLSRRSCQTCLARRARRGPSLDLE
jgi:hypothetical protein